ncbi:hypothetical protein SAMN06297387_12825 [Streptomyces zhaozhouensis]|uniref:Uncharacterized protein n=1 Tax=Streptomyces zhaozhouensis TaxID=1300267 RepID=A0A286E7Y0_9ACTN|nr:hypothetical protein SAMN06297387_12825 [Streptomyces zhaozhouensis]
MRRVRVGDDNVLRDTEQPAVPERETALLRPAFRSGVPGDLTAVLVDGDGSGQHGGEQRWIGRGIE